MREVGNTAARECLVLLWHSPKSAGKYDAKTDARKCVDEVFGAPKSERNKEFVDKILMQF